MGLLKSMARVIIGFDILFFLLLGFSFLHLEPGTGSYVVAQLTLVPTVLTFVASIVVVRTEWEPF